MFSSRDPTKEHTRRIKQQQKDDDEIRKWRSPTENIFYDSDKDNIELIEKTIESHNRAKLKLHHMYNNINYYANRNGLIAREILMSLGIDVDVLEKELFVHDNDYTREKTVGFKKAFFKSRYIEDINKKTTQYKEYFDRCKTAYPEICRSSFGGRLSHTKLEKLTIKELQHRCKERKIKYSGLRKAELITALRRKGLKA
jgi:hypothetical protein